MLLELLLFVCVSILILIFFYKQANTEFQINQVETLEKIPKLIHERNPIVIQPFLAPKDLWTHSDIQQRQSLSNIIIPNLNITIQEALQEKGKSIPWSTQFASKVAEITGLPVWASQTFKSLFQGQSLLTSLYSYDTEVYLGPQGLQKTFGLGTILFTTEGTATVTILNEQSDPYLPKAWKGKRLSLMTRDDAPLISQIECMDIVVRPGSALLLPPHWKYCVEESDKDSSPICLVRCIIHHPISRLMARADAKKN